MQQDSFLANEFGLVVWECAAGRNRTSDLPLLRNQYKAGALPLSYDGGGVSTRDRTEVAGWLKGGFPTVKARSPDHWTIETNTSGGIRTHEV